MSDRPLFTYQTRVAAAPEADAVLSAWAELYGRAERSLFAAMRGGGARNDLKHEFLRRFGITARQFNAIRIGLDGKIASIKQRRPELIVAAAARIAKAKKVVARLEQRYPDSTKLHQKKRRLGTLQARLVALQADESAGATRLCFGSKRLFRAQFDLEANGYASHAAWQADWRAARSNQFFVLGSQDETAGNQTCQATVAEDGSLTLTLRLPDALAAHGRQLVLPGVRFAYGHPSIVAALRSSRRVTALTKAGAPTIKRIGVAISYRLVRDAKGWRVFASVEAPPVTQVSQSVLGTLGVDLNADHLAVAETDRFGNLVAVQRFDLPLYGKSTEQAKALIGDAAVTIAAMARAAGKPLVVEILDFAKKKAELGANPRQARMLSSFACNKTLASLKASCFRAGVEVMEVNPAYTSVIGAVNHAQARGISVHQGAAYAIARRGLGLSEAPAVRKGLAPARNGGHVTFALPVRNRAKHVWSYWSKIRTRLKAAHAAHFRSGAAQANPAPLRQIQPASSAIRISTARFRGANRSQHCSESVLADVPQ